MQTIFHHHKKVLLMDVFVLAITLNDYGSEESNNLELTTVT